MADGAIDPGIVFEESDSSLMPKDWQVVKLGDVADLKLGRTPARKETRYWDDGIIPWIKIQDLNNGVVSRSSEAISLEALAEVFKGHFIPRGTLLLSFKLTIGKVGILGVDAVHNEAIASVFPQEHIADRQFLFYLFQFIDYDAYLDSYVKGKTLNKRKLRAFPIPLPPLPEQRKIAKVLSTIQEAIEHQDNVIASARELKKSLVCYLFTYGPVSVVEAERVSLKDTEVGAIPHQWEVVPFNSAAVVSRGISWRKIEQSPDGVPVIGIPNIRGGRVDLNIRYRIAKNVVENKRLHAGDILLVGSSGSVHNIGRAAVLRENPHPILAFASFLVKVAPKPNISDRDFLFYLVQSPLVDYAACSRRAADGKYNLHVSELKRWPVPLPPLPEQKEIAAFLSTADRKIEAEEQRKALLQEFFKTMIQKLMTGQIRVKDVEV